MTGNSTRVATVWTRQRAGLLAAAFCQAVGPVADPSAAVHLTRQRFVTRQAARNVLQMTRDVAALLEVKEKEHHFTLLSGIMTEYELDTRALGKLPRASPCTISE